MSRGASFSGKKNRIKKLDPTQQFGQFGSKIRVSKICFPAFGPKFGFWRCKSQCAEMSPWGFLEPLDRKLGRSNRDRSNLPSALRNKLMLFGRIVSRTRSITRREFGTLTSHAQCHISLGVHSLNLEHETSTGVLANLSQEFANFKREFTNLSKHLPNLSEN